MDQSLSRDPEGGLLGGRQRPRRAVAPEFRCQIGANSSSFCVILGVSPCGNDHRALSHIPPRRVESIALSDTQCLSLLSSDFELSSFSHVGNAGSTPAGITNKIKAYFAIGLRLKVRLTAKFDSHQ
jgi:hypothetical protein